VAEGTLFVMTGASGVGKGTLRKRLLEREKLFYSISMTTRPPRPGERHGVDYWFVSRERFLELVEAKKFLEHASYVNNLYGTPLDPVLRHLKRGEDVLLEIEVQGAKQVREKAEELGLDAVFIFIVPPSLTELRRRLLFRESQRGPDKLKEVAARIKRAEEEIKEALSGGGFDYVVINDVLEEATQELVTIVRAARLKRERRRDALERALERDPELEAELDEIERWLMQGGGTGN